MIENLLFKREIQINEKIRLKVPTVEQVLDSEDEYYSIISMLTAMPIDMMVQLDDMGIDFSKIDDYELFLLMFQGLSNAKTDLVFCGEFDPGKFQIVENSQNGMIVLRNEEDDIVIDRNIQGMIANALRKMHYLTKDERKPGNAAAMQYMIEKERKRQKRRRNKKQESQLEPLIVAMVNTEQYKYGFEETKGLTIYQFNQCVHQIIKKVEYDNRMLGVYTGNIDSKSLSQDDLNWLNHK